MSTRHGHRQRFFIFEAFLSAFLSDDRALRFAPHLDLDLDLSVSVPDDGPSVLDLLVFRNGSSSCLILNIKYFIYYNLYKILNRRIIILLLLFIVVYKKPI